MSETGPRGTEVAKAQTGGAGGGRRHGGISRGEFLGLVGLAASSGLLASCGVIKTGSGDDAMKEEEGATMANIVLVHGAWADGYGTWAGVIPTLQAADYRVVAAQLPLTSLEDDVSTVRRVLGTLDGPTVLAGHSYGGAVISGAATGAPGVVGLVYAAAFAPDEGEVLQNDIIERFDPPPGLAAIRPDAGGFLWLDQDAMPEVFAADVDAGQAALMAATQNPIAARCFGEDKAGPPAWRSLPTWYLISANDRTVDPAAERWMAERMGAETREVSSSHASPVSRPREVAETVLEAARSVPQN